jgi:putative Mg2+ transporter-C (MgtC) family protein
MEPSTTIAVKELILRLSIAALVGSILGLNRELKGKPAGLRTHALVTLGAAVATLTGVQTSAIPLTPDPNALARIIQGVLTGIGFLGAGVIINDVSGRSVHGLTTAATIWVAASLGIACGIGQFAEVAVAIGLIFVILILGGPVERLVNRVFNRDKGKTPGQAHESADAGDSR